MPKNSSPTPASTPDIQKIVKKWRQWRSDLQQYWPEIQKMQEMYEFFKREGSETASDVGLNTAFAIVESMVSRLNDTNMSVTAKAHGTNNMDLFERYVGNILKSAIYDRGVEQVAGPFRKTKEIIERDFLVKGNFAAEVSYCYQTTIRADGSKKVVADNPMVRPLSLFSVVFDPAKTLMTSDEYFVEKYVDIDYLEDRAQADGTGTYVNIDKLKLSLQNGDSRTRPVENQNFISGDFTVTRVAAPIRLLEHWKGAKLTVIANDTVLVREAYDPMKLGTHPLILGMNYVVEGRPYGYGEINAIYKPVRAQDTILNQRIETINQYLRGTVFVDPDSNIDLDMVATMLESGGVGYGNPEAVKSLDKPLPPSAAYTETGELQSAIERTARFSPYSTGTPSSGTDTTQGTKGGIIALQGAAEPNFQVKVDGITDMFLTPLAYKYLPMMANLMSTSDIRWGEVQGEDQPWVGATKNILLGKPSLSDLQKVGMLTDEQFQARTTTPVLGPDGQPLVDPQTGQPQTQPIPGAATATMVEIDWIVEVTMDVKSAHDRQSRLQTAQNMITWLQGIGVHFSPARTASFFETKMDELKGLETIILTQEEMQAMSSQGPREQLRVNVNFSDLPPEGQVQAAAQAGINLEPADINAHMANKALMEHGSKMDQAFAAHASKAHLQASEQQQPEPVASPA